MAAEMGSDGVGIGFLRYLYRGEGLGNAVYMLKYAHPRNALLERSANVLNTVPIIVPSIKLASVPRFQLVRLGCPVEEGSCMQRQHQY